MEIRRLSQVFKMIQMGEKSHLFETIINKVNWTSF